MYGARCSGYRKRGVRIAGPARASEGALGPVLAAAVPPMKAAAFALAGKTVWFVPRHSY